MPSDASPRRAATSPPAQSSCWADDLRRAIPRSRAARGVDNPAAPLGARHPLRYAAGERRQPMMRTFEQMAERATTALRGELKGLGQEFNEEDANDAIPAIGTALILEAVRFHVASSVFAGVTLDQVHAELHN